ncbi:type II toxin-antitoxin system Phd/YefM family antitoxin [Novosphingobium acidiphilum]|uniref:type II toxin-antitoxin system Phd/YefM family antitoxin n=1 Tax=Novosphingobium acidiphilum TaxID=505248 RepID=UPI00041DF8C5|nr:type II toxin-antitoxin system Phd/YefM family antitoxin [Novosphingobium acidiphilum]
MSVHYVSSRDFSRDPGRAKKATSDGTVFITNHDKPTHVLMRIEEFRRITGEGQSIVEKLTMASDVEVDFDPPRAVIGLKPADLF